MCVCRIRQKLPHEFSLIQLQDKRWTQFILLFFMFRLLYYPAIMVCAQGARAKRERVKECISC